MSQITALFPRPIIKDGRPVLQLLQATGLMGDFTVSAVPGQELDLLRLFRKQGDKSVPRPKSTWVAHNCTWLKGCDIEARWYRDMKQNCWRLVVKLLSGPGAERSMLFYPQDVDLNVGRPEYVTRVEYSTEDPENWTNLRATIGFEASRSAIGWYGPLVSIQMAAIPVEGGAAAAVPTMGYFPWVGAYDKFAVRASGDALDVAQRLVEGLCAHIAGSADDVRSKVLTLVRDSLAKELEVRVRLNEAVAAIDSFVKNPAKRDKAKGDQALAALRKAHGEGAAETPELLAKALGDFVSAATKAVKAATQVIFRGWRLDQLPLQLNVPFTLTLPTERITPGQAGAEPSRVLHQWVLTATKMGEDGKARRIQISGSLMRTLCVDERLSRIDRDIQGLKGYLALGDVEIVKKVCEILGARKGDEKVEALLASTIDELVEWSQAQGKIDNEVAGSVYEFLKRKHGDKIDSDPELLGQLLGDLVEARVRRNGQIETSGIKGKWWNHRYHAVAINAGPGSWVMTLTKSQSIDIARGAERAEGLAALGAEEDDENGDAD